MRQPEYKPKQASGQYTPISQPNSNNYIVKQGYTSYCTHFAVPPYFFALCCTPETSHISTLNHNRITTYYY